MIYDERMLSRKLKIRQPNFPGLQISPGVPKFSDHTMILTLIKIPEPVNTVIAAIVLPAKTSLKYFLVSVLHHKL